MPPQRTPRLALFAAHQAAFGPHLELPHWPQDAAELFRWLETEYPTARPAWARCRLAINHDFAHPEQTITPGDELALIPPVSGGGRMNPRREALRIELTDRPIDPAAWWAWATRPDCGAVVLFTGTVREWTGPDRTEALCYQAYAPMAEQELARIAEELMPADQPGRMGLIHRLGPLSIGEIAVLVVVSTPHRAEAFRRAETAMERIKRDVPIWKQDITPAAPPVWIHPEGPHP